MTKPEVVCCPDGHFRRAVYGLGPYIADYPEQALLACIVQGWCPKLVFGFILMILIVDEKLTGAQSHSMTPKEKAHVAVANIQKNLLSCWS
jgi:hypothetical protein